MAKEGRPLRYKSKAELQAAIEAYFVEINGHPLLDDKGHPVFDKWGSPVIIGQRPPTITGLALHLGFASRQSLLDYQGRAEFLDTITRAKLRVEAYAEERLYDRDGVNGARFVLLNNFKGWRDRPQDEDDVSTLGVLREIIEAVRRIE